MRAKVLETALSGLILLPLLAVACGGDDEEAGGFGGGGGEGPDPALVRDLESLPVFPEAESASLADGRYRVDNYNDGILFASFEVPNQTTAEDVIAFFGKALPPAGWKEERPAWTATVEGPLANLQTGERSATTSTYYTFLKDETRLLVEVPIGRARKDETPPPPGGVSYVNLILARKDIELFPSPIGTPVDSTPPPTPRQVTPAFTAPPVPSYEPTPVTPTP